MIQKEIQKEKHKGKSTSESSKIKRLKVDKENIEIKEIFADPTYDSTFKMLFGTEKKKDILISILNSLLGFKGEKQILDVQVDSSNLITEGVQDVKGAVDVLCTTKGHQKIAVEMQRKYKDYLLPRSQEYMSKLIIGQVQDGQGKQYDKALMDTYILSIEKQNVFRGKYQLSDKKLFEVTVEYKKLGRKYQGIKCIGSFLNYLSLSNNIKAKI